RVPPLPLPPRLPIPAAPALLPPGDALRRLLPLPPSRGPPAPHASGPVRARPGPHRRRQLPPPPLRLLRPPDAALALFRRIPAKSLVSLNTVVDTLAGNGDHLGALDLFREMQRGTGLTPEAYTVQSVLGVCAGAGALSLGVYAHALLRQLGDHGDVSRDVVINNSLVDL
uniref:Pentacotripeptide-repeat region of PRORP domain-containing protein n=1 Tax=Aegilops tauschii subsp. strangulata TaxID=200361 RepID=A0A453MCG9_AEGTS